MVLLEVILLFFYLTVLVVTSVDVITKTESASKTLAYLLLIIVLPVFGILFYFSFGVSHRHSKFTKVGARINREIEEELENRDDQNTLVRLENNFQLFNAYRGLIDFISEIGNCNLTNGEFSLLVNGERKFPEVLRTLSDAQHHIHMEYYSWENDHRGNQIKDVLIERLKNGVKVRILYDAYASRGIKNNIVKELRRSGAEVFPKVKIKLSQFANRLNHRDHRKIIVVDGVVGFMGGINISDRYDNTLNRGKYWRDTHIRLEGPLVQTIQKHWIISWNMSVPDEFRCSTQFLLGQISVDTIRKNDLEAMNGLGQIVAGGPIYPRSNIMLTYFRLFNSAKKSLYITNPYFIPNPSIIDALVGSALSGVDVRLLVPEKSDSQIVGAASRFYFKKLLDAGVRIYLYNKGFVHAKTVIIDQFISVVGSANLDIRSFDLNFEIMSLVYNQDFGAQCEELFLNDLENSLEFTNTDWHDISKFKKLLYSIARLISSFL